MRFPRYPVVSVAITALAVGVLHCMIIVLVFGKGAPGGPGRDGYTEIVRSLVAGEGYRLAGELNFFRPPTYVLFLMPWIALPGTHFWILASQSLLGAARANRKCPLT